MKPKNNTESEEKQRILSMNKYELITEKWKKKDKKKNIDCSNCSNCSDCSDCSDCSSCSNCSDCSDCSDCFDCSYCSDCSDCSDCSSCSNCSYCVRQKNKKYMIANVQFTKEEYEEWIKKNEKQKSN